MDSELRTTDRLEVLENIERRTIAWLVLVCSLDLYTISLIVKPYSLLTNEFMSLYLFQD